MINVYTSLVLVYVKNKSRRDIMIQYNISLASKFFFLVKLFRRFHFSGSVLSFGPIHRLQDIINPMFY